MSGGRGGRGGGGGGGGGGVEFEAALEALSVVRAVGRHTRYHRAEGRKVGTPLASRGKPSYSLTRCSSSAPPATRRMRKSLARNVCETCAQIVQIARMHVHVHVFSHDGTLCV